MHDSSQRRQELPAARPPALAGEAWSNAAAKLTGAALAFALFIVLARAMTPEAFGDTALVLAWVAVGTAIAGMSMPFVVVRHVAQDVAEGNLGRARGVVRFALERSVWAAVGLALATIVANRLKILPVSDTLGSALEIGATMLVPSVLLGNLVALLQARKRVLAAEVLSNVLRSTVAIVAIAGVVLAGNGALGAPAALALYSTALVLAVVLCAAYARRSRPAGWREAVIERAPAAWWRSARGFFGVFVAAAVAERIDVLLLGLAGNATELAVYAVATRFAQVMMMAVNASNSVMAPHFVELLPALSRGHSDPVERLVKTTARTTMALVGLAAVAFVLLGPWLLALFGAHYSVSYVPLVILAAGQVAAAWFGPAAAVAALAGRPAIAIAAIAAGTLANALLNLALVPHWGAVGAAVAAAAGLVATSAIAWHTVRRSLAVDASLAQQQLAGSPRWR